MSIIFALRAKRFLKKGCTRYLVSLSGKEKVTPKLEEMTVVCVYLKVFPRIL